MTEPGLRGPRGPRRALLPGLAGLAALALLSATAAAADLKVRPSTTSAPSGLSSSTSSAATRSSSPPAGLTSQSRTATSLPWSSTRPPAASAGPAAAAPASLAASARTPSATATPTVTSTRTPSTTPPSLATSTEPRATAPAASRTRRPATTASSSATSTRPPATTATSSATSTRPPATTATSSATSTRPPATAPTPPSTRKPAASTRPPATHSSAPAAAAAAPRQQWAGLAATAQPPGPSSHAASASSPAAPSAVTSGTPGPHRSTAAFEVTTAAPGPTATASRRPDQQAAPCPQGDQCAGAAVVPDYRSGDPTALRGDIFQRSKLEPAETSSADLVTGVVTSSHVTAPTPAPTMTLLNLAENLISGFAVMVLQSQVHVDEPGAVERKDEKAQNQLEDIFFKPEPMQFATTNNTVVVAQRGTTAYLPCVIKNIADGLVTWLRRRDHHLLTVARGGYAQDERFQVVHDQHPEDWTMQLKFVTDRDAGRYECQVSTHPPVSNFIHLRVVEARCVIEGPAEKFVRSGSQLRLSCHIEQGTTEPEYMFWFKDGVMVNYDHQNIYQVTVDLPNNTTVLVVERATRAQSGNYTCEAAQAKSASNYVHVISGENPAAMQTGGVGIGAQPLWLTVLVLVAGARLAGLALG